MARRKSKAVDAPQNLSEALPLLGQYARLEAIISEASAQREAGIAALNEDYNAQAAPLLTEPADLTVRIKAWFEANRSALTLDKRKSIEIGGCEIGHRTGNPTLKLPKGMNEAAAIAWLNGGIENGYAWAKHMIRTVESLDKPVMMRVLRLEAPSLATMALNDAGFDVTQREQFFIVSTAPQPEAMIDIPVTGTVQ